MQRALFFSLLASVFALAAVPAHANNDTVQFGSNINITAEHPVHDAVCFFCSVRIEGEATGDIVAFFGSVYIDGIAHHDVVNFFGHITAADNSMVGGDMVSFFGSVRLGENVRVGKDMVVMFGSLRAPGSVSIGKDRVVQPAWVLLIPLCVFALIVIAIVSAFRACQRRRLLSTYPMPPRP